MTQSFFGLILISLFGVIAQANPLLAQGDHYEGKLYINNVDQNRSCSMQVLAVKEDSQTGIDCYSYEVQITENGQPITVSSNVYRIDDSGKYCESAQGNMGDFYVESAQGHQQLTVEFSEHGKMTSYNLARLTGLISRTVYNCQLSE